MTASLPLRAFLWSLLAGALLIVLGAFALSRRPLPPRSSVVVATAVHGTVPSFELLDQTGESFSSDRLRGRVWIADFIFTSCAGSCPEMTRKMSSLKERLGPGIELVSISVDPARDTPPVLSEYARRALADPRRWHFLTGDPQEISRLVQKGFGLALAEGNDPSEPILHSIRFVLVDRAGKIRGFYDSNDPRAVEQLLRDARAL